MRFDDARPPNGRRPSPFAAWRGAAWAYVALFALAGFAFWPKYLSQLGGPIDPYTHAHAIVATGWCLLLVAQPLLATRDVAAHRALGLATYALAPAFVLAAVLLAHARFRAMDEATFRQEAPTLFLPLSAALLFSVSFFLAVRHRRETPLHARLMVLTGLPMIDPVLGRVLFFFLPPLPHPLLYQAVTFGLTDLVVLLMFFVPPASARVRRAYAAPAALFVLAHAFWFTLAQGPAWVPFAAWFRSLPLP
ncbi:MAG TPA: hypothetical protein PLB01_05790 [Thermoanaerobaculia bacterium]|nr:hypothetical protein [Thermoanaerobaculia bacterium]